MTRIIALLSLLLANTARAAEPPTVDFDREVLPILSDFCFPCHGPDPKARKADLRLDIKESALQVVLPGKPAESSLIVRVSSKDADEVMPPPSLKRKLSAVQIDTLKRWVEQGAKWNQHWAFEPVAKVIPPVSRDARRNSWVRSPLDAFVMHSLEREHLSPAPPADKSRLLRRVTFDLTGLPPTLAELDAFLADNAPDAYEKVVDRLLASPRYGERMASQWLDLARFADTHGYQMDRFRAVWPYRDWVINSFNRNQPFDEFAAWQIAGDLLPNATQEQRLATAFNRLHMQNEEGGIVAEEFRIAYVVDRVNTFGTAFLGLTFECSRCHDHKYDPITQKDFYSLSAFFQNIDESGQTSYFTAATPVPALMLTTPVQEAKITQLRAVIAEKQTALASAHQAAKAEFVHWQRPVKTESIGLIASFSLDEMRGNRITNRADAKKPGTRHEVPKLVPGKSGSAAFFDGENGFEFPGIGHFTRDDPFTLSLWLKAPAATQRAVILHHSKAPIDAGSRGYELLLEDGRLAFGLHHMWPGNSLKVRTASVLPIEQWKHITVAYDGSSLAAGITIFVDGKSVKLEIVRDKLTKDITYSGAEPNLAMAFRFRDNGLKGGAIDEFRVYNRALSSLEAAELAGEKPSEVNWFDYYTAVVHEPSRKARDELRLARKALTALVNPLPEIMVMDELPKPRPAFVLKRGAYDAHGEAVTANTPTALPPMQAGLPHNRLGLAKWLTQSEQPLFARVTVNRAWQMMFGRGLVETSDNFGTQGARPTHPKLLDWLARDFASSGWDYKRLLRQIALSSTYRQSSQATAELLARDPQNEWLARGPVKRLTAEMLRDQAIFDGGLLVEKQGGPSVKPYQPAGLWEEIAMGRPHYGQGKGADLYRRSLYTFWKRTVPPPSMVTFDAADRSVCSVRRQSTSTPLQSLVLLNDTQFVEAARFVGQRSLKEGGTRTADRVAFAFRLITSRMPNARERAVLERLFVEQKALFLKDPDAVKKLLSVGEKRADASMPGADLAAATVLANVLLNHDDAVWLR